MTVSVEALNGQFEDVRLPEKYSQQCRIAEFLRTFIIRKSGKNIKPIPQDAEPELLQEAVRRFQAMSDALLLGLPFSMREKTEKIEQRVLEVVPERLQERGVEEGARIQTNFEPDPEIGRLVVRGFAPVKATVRLRPLAYGEEEEVSAVNLAIKATPYSGPQSRR